MKTILFASRNSGKVREVRAMLAEAGVEIRSLADYPHLPEIAEDGNSFFENALRKAKTAAELTGEIALADDSGLEVEALGGAPGIYSARYAGPDADDGRNIAKLLKELRGVPPAERRAAFCCVVVLCRPDGSCESFAGRWRGQIAEEPAGEGGFGYDPVFLLPERGLTAAQLTAEEKNRLSHRAQALEKLKHWILKGNAENGA
ncbi:MAG: XTP/dITP diphosphatase [Syntrophales bacterium]